ncbi:MAG: bifunctional tetrahydrofolate synthase/dihydrofolate synthase [Burkholderiales bacterium]
MKFASPPGSPGGLPVDLPAWLHYIDSRHSRPIDLGLDRVREVRDRMGLTPAFPVITVGGTNGKGSTCAMLEAILRCGGFRVGCYTSPHLLRYNERVKVSGRMVSDTDLCEAFAAVESARGSTPLTYFEFGTLAAVWHFLRTGVEVAILEVGLGGRLDAVNAFDADCAAVTSIGIDHIDYLGSTRESIGAEKAGIFRTGRPAVIGEPRPPATLVGHAAGIGARVLLAGEDFRAIDEATQWRYEGPGATRAGLPFPALRGSYQIHNAAIALTILDTLKACLPLSSGAVREGLLTVELPGRFQVLPGVPVMILDVAHNPHAAEKLSQALGAMKCTGRTHAVFGMLRDKDIAGVAGAVKAHVDRWYLGPLEGPRGADAQTLLRALDEAGVYDEARAFANVREALDVARAAAGADDRILVFGSFLTVSHALEARASRAL